MASAKYMMNKATEPASVLEGNIAQWIWQQNLTGIQRPYIWPGSWPAKDLEWAEQHLGQSQFDAFDGMIIYYEAWDPEIPGAVDTWNQSQDRWHARTIHSAGVWRSPRDLILIVDRQRSDQVMMSMWLGLGETQ